MDPTTLGPDFCSACGHAEKGADGSDTHPDGGPCLICKARRMSRFCPDGWNGQAPDSEESEA